MNTQKWRGRCRNGRIWFSIKIITSNTSRTIHHTIEDLQKLDFKWYGGSVILICNYEIKMIMQQFWLQLHQREMMDQLKENTTHQQDQENLPRVHNFDSSYTNGLALIAWRTSWCYSIASIQSRGHLIIFISIMDYHSAKSTCTIYMHILDVADKIKCLCCWDKFNHLKQYLRTFFISVHRPNLVRLIHYLSWN